MPALWIVELSINLNTPVVLFPMQLMDNDLFVSFAKEMIDLLDVLCF